MSQLAKKQVGEKSPNWTGLWTKDYKKKYYAKRRRERFRELRTLAIKMYGGICNCCKEDKIEFLTIDHINNGGKQHRKEKNSTYEVYRDITKSFQPEKYRILCMNCNFAIRYGKKCPHTKNNE